MAIGSTRWGGGANYHLEAALASTDWFAVGITENGDNDGEAVFVGWNQDMPVLIVEYITPPSAPSIFRVHPPNPYLFVEVGELVHLVCRAVDEDCDLWYFDWGHEWQDPSGGCEDYSSITMTISVPGQYYMPVWVIDHTGLQDMTWWEIVVVSPVARTSWGAIKSLYKVR